MANSAIILNLEVKKTKYKIPASNFYLKSLIKTVLQKERIYKARLAILLVDDAFIKQLNRKFLAKNSATDVLSFNLDFANAKFGLTGDVIVSVDRAYVVSKELKLPFKEELCRYIIHGILHLIGYNDLVNIEKKKMWKKQEELLKLL